MIHHGKSVLPKFLEVEGRRDLVTFHPLPAEEWTNVLAPSVYKKPQTVCVCTHVSPFPIPLRKSPPIGRKTRGVN
uniref:Uncharacterized protein n=1 Tax=Steinernema glaseri TaxID=37863 RepID=A0A1I7Y6X0_9BILA